MRYYSVSDLHIDYRENAEWVRQLPLREYRDDALLLGGDISHDLPGLEDCLSRLRERFGHLFFVAGNHDVWVRRSEGMDSAAKLLRIEELCERLDVLIQPAMVGGHWIVPLPSWYDFSFGTPGPELRQRWADFSHCVWPAGMDQVQINAWWMSRVDLSVLPAGASVLSFSHFMPRLDILPDRVDPARYWLSPVLGSKALGEQVSALKPLCHVCGHSHLNFLKKIGNTVFLNNAFGYPAEAAYTRKRLLQIKFTESGVNIT